MKMLRKKEKLDIIIHGIISKKADGGISWENRYIVITNKKLLYYYTDRDYIENREPLGYFEIKHIYNLVVLPDYGYGSKNIFELFTSQWYKKDAIQSGRSYILSTSTKEKLNDWVTTINFLRVKSNYDEFAAQFGRLNLPLPHEVQGKTEKKG